MITRNLTKEETNFTNSKKEYLIIHNIINMEDSIKNGLLNIEELTKLILTNGEPLIKKQTRGTTIFDQFRKQHKNITYDNKFMKILDTHAVKVFNEIFDNKSNRLSNIIGIAATSKAEDGPIHIDYSDTQDSYTMFIAITYCEILGYKRKGYHQDQLLLEEITITLHPGDMLLTKADFIHAAKRNSKNNLKAFWFIDNKAKPREKIRNTQTINILRYKENNDDFPKYVIINDKNYKELLKPEAQKPPITYNIIEKKLIEYAQNNSTNQIKHLLHKYISKQSIISDTIIETLANLDNKPPKINYDCMTILDWLIHAISIIKPQNEYNISNKINLTTENCNIIESENILTTIYKGIKINNTWSFESK